MKIWFQKHTIIGRNPWLDETYPRHARAVLGDGTEVTFVGLPDAALSEARRVLKPGGRFFCLEFSRVAIAPLRPVYDRYSDIVIPKLGEIVAKDRDSYVYLVESIRRFPDQEALIGRMEQAGFAFNGYRNLSAGIAAIHHARRI